MVPLTEWHADAVALSVQEAPDLCQIAVPLAVVLVHGALQQKRIVGLEDACDALLRALHKHAGLLRVHEVPHTLVGLVARVLQGFPSKQSQAGVTNGSATIFYHF